MPFKYSVNKTGHGAGGIKDPNSEMMSTVNKFTLEDLKKEEVFIGKLLLAHNAIDRDGERFSERMLENFATTIPGKSFIDAHRHGPPGFALFFDAKVISMSKDEAYEKTGEDLKLPPTINEVKFLKVYYYMLNNDANKDMVDNILAGIRRHVSIGFGAEERSPVKDSQENVLYYEYRGKGEALEGSFVWLGAQPGATTTAKGASPASASSEGANSDGDQTTKKSSLKKEEETEEQKAMNKLFFKALGLSEDASETEVLKALGVNNERIKSLELIVAPLGDDVTAETVKTLQRQAECGVKFIDSLVDDIVAIERQKGRVGDSEDEVKARKDQLKSRSVDELQGDLKFYQGDESAGGDNADKGASSSTLGKAPVGSQAGNSEGRKSYRKP